MYGITEVCYDSTPERINSVKVHQVLSDGSLGTSQVWKKQDVVNAINVRREVFYTYPPSNGKPRQGARVEVVPLNGQYYIRTDRNSIARDNLGELPRFYC
jgi:hypothetical protein